MDDSERQRRFWNAANGKKIDPGIDVRQEIKFCIHQKLSGYPNTVICENDCPSTVRKMSFCTEECERRTPGKRQWTPEVEKTLGRLTIIHPRNGGKPGTRKKL